MKTPDLALIGDDAVLDAVEAALSGRSRPATRLRGDVARAAVRTDDPAALVWIIGTRVGSEDGEEWLRRARAAGEQTAAVLLRPPGPAGSMLPPGLGATRPVNATAGAEALLAAIEAVTAAIAPPRAEVDALADEVADEVARLSREYGRELPAKLAALQAALDLAMSGGGPTVTRAAVAAARDVAHRLKGTAGSFGYAALGSEMGALEQHLRCYLEKGAALDSDIIHNSITAAIALFSYFPSNP